MAKEAPQKHTAKRRPQQVSLTQKAGGQAAAPRKKAKKASKVPVGKLILAVLAIGLVVALVFFGITVWNLVKGYFGGDNNTGTAPVPYETEGKAAYYLFGLFGEEDTADMEMLSLVCYDKQAKTVQVMQIPSATYLDDTDKWAVKTVGGVFANPKPLDWCTTCRRSVYQSEMQDGRHNANTPDGTYCGTLLTKQAGSAVASLLEVFNHQYTLPIDNYFLVPQEGFVRLVDWVGGVDIALESAMTLSDVSYDAGVQTLDGKAALQYVKNTGKTVTSQVDNLVHQRQVFAALFERLFNCKRAYLDDEVLYPLMKSSTPIRTRRDKELADDITLMIDLVQELATVPRENIAVCLLPGEAATADGVNYYSVHKEALSALLNESFNPNGLAIAPEHLQMTELANTREDDIQRQTMAELLVSQNGQISTEAEE